ncbi:kinetochore Sim4 complex subunit Fta4 [Schizothecium vesticola]|uniref:Kinetochore Sim4 complex subunit Fta4 n=1 Tax=Schizothecium vesticola TaxID=314040 RepID=A0AA40KAS9_9PEZI|nr:kinetochore Sim4 complex subunit Fta4 [Schizothecium vesticola]
MPSPPTVVHLKQSFLTTETRLLSQPLSPSRAWLNTNTAHDEGLPPKAVDDALFKLNQRLQQHTRRVYAPQATRHVAEQIDALYWNAALAASESRDGDDDDDILKIGSDLVDTKTITALPPSWSTVSSSQAEEFPLEAARYIDAVAELQALDARREGARARVVRLQRMKGLLAPFEDAAETVQENLVTRNGEVEAEMQRMRMLLARVGGRVGQLKEGQQGAGEEGEGGIDEEGRKVGLLLDRF